MIAVTLIEEAGLGVSTVIAVVLLLVALRGITIHLFHHHDDDGKK